jgi:hypothetical protein
MNTLEATTGRERKHLTLFRSDGKVVRDVVSLVGPVQNFHQNETLFCTIGVMKLLCKYTVAHITKTIALNVDASDDIVHIKEKIQLQLKTPIEQQTLLYETQELRDEKMLGDYQIAAESCIHLRHTAGPMLGPSWERHIVFAFPAKMQTDVQTSMTCQLSIRTSCGEYLMQCLEQFLSNVPLMSNLLHTTLPQHALWCEDNIANRVMLVELKPSLYKNAQNQMLSAQDIDIKINDVRKIAIRGGDIRSWQLYTAALPIVCEFVCVRNEPEIHILLKPRCMLKAGTWYAVLLLHTNRYISKDTVFPFQTKKLEVIDLRPNMLTTHGSPKDTESTTLPMSTDSVRTGATAVMALQPPRARSSEITELRAPPAKRHRTAAKSAVREHAVNVVDSGSTSATAAAACAAFAAVTTVPTEQHHAICLICLERPANIAYSPCGHVASCPSCDQALSKRKCILCRAHIHSVLKVYL